MRRILNTKQSSRKHRTIRAALDPVVNSYYEGTLVSTKNGVDYTVYGVDIKTTENEETSSTYYTTGFSTTAKTLINMSSEFTTLLPADTSDFKSYIFKVAIKDSGSSANDCFVILGNNNTASTGTAIRCTGLADDSFVNDEVWVAPDSNGDVYIQIQASGASTMDIYIVLKGWTI